MSSVEGGVRESDAVFSLVPGGSLPEKAAELFVKDKDVFCELFAKVKKVFLFVRDGKGEFIAVTREVSDLLGCPAEEFCAGWRGFLPQPLDDEKAPDLVSKDLSAQAGEVMLVEFMHRDGYSVWVEMAQSPVYDQSGQIVLMRGVAVDCTQRKRLENEKSFSESRFREMSEFAPVGIFQVDPDDSYTFVNTHWQSITGRTLRETLGATWWRVVHDEDQDEVFKNWVAAEAAGQEFSAECRVQKASGEVRWVQLRSRFFFHDRGKFTFGTMMDITARRTAENQLAGYAEELKRSNQALDDFAAIASHDLQEPLRKIITFGDRLKELYSGALDERGRDYLARMQGAATRMKRFIHDLLDFSRISTRAKPFADTDLETVVAEVLVDLEARLQETKGAVEVAGPLPVIEGELFQLRQLFQNLIGNALKFNRPGVPPVVKIAAEQDLRKGVWLLTVSDNGIGFDDKFADRIFKPFERLHGRAEYEGTGMGLAICRKIVARHGGDITVKSKAGEGTAFSIMLPARQKK